MRCDYCNEAEAKFWVFEKWTAPDAVGGVERMDPICPGCLTDCRPEHAEHADRHYEFEIEIMPEQFGMRTVE